MYQKKCLMQLQSHNNIIFLYPNALYAEIEVDMSKNEITLIRGHGLSSRNYEWI